MLLVQRFKAYGFSKQAQVDHDSQFVCWREGNNVFKFWDYTEFVYRYT